MAPLITKKIPVLIRANYKFFITGLITFLFSFIIMVIIFIKNNNNIDNKNFEIKKELQSQIQSISNTIADTVLPYISFLNEERKFLDSSLALLSLRIDSTQKRLVKFQRKYIHDNKFIAKYIFTRDGFNNPDSLANYAANVCMNVYGRMLDELQSRIPPQEPCNEETKVIFHKNQNTENKISIRIDEKK